MDDHKTEEMSANQQQVNDMAEVADDSRRVETATKVGDGKRIDENKVNIKIVLEISLVNPVNPGEKSTGKDDMDEITFGEIVGPSGDGLRILDGPMNKSGIIRPQGLDKQHTWTRLARMDYGPVELLKEGAKSILGKRINQGQQQVSLDSIDEQAGKKVKSRDVSQSIEAAGVSEHPCQAQ